MKRLIALLLVLSVGVSLLTACAGKEPGAETGAVADPAATAPTEFLELRRPQETQAPHVEVIGPGKPHNGTTPGGERQDPVSLGILTPEQLADPQRIVTVGEASVPETQRCAVTVQNEKSHPPVQRVGFLYYL